MPFAAHTVQVLIASPGDVAEERAALRRAMWEWNDEHAEALGVVLLPVGWETHARPELGDHPQHLIDRQIAEKSDVLVGVFWTRLGTATPESASGTVHEIEEFAKAGKPVLLYFSDRPAVPAAIELDQVQAVREFRTHAETLGLIGRFDEVASLVTQVRTALLRLVRDRFNLPTAVVPAGGSASAPRVIATVKTEREEESRDAKGKVRYTTRESIILKNTGGATARHVSIAWAYGAEGPMIHEGDSVVDYLSRDAEVTYRMFGSMGDDTMGTLEIRWQDEDGKDYEEKQTVRI